MTARVWDVAIIGGGPAGLTAGLYAARAGLDVVILDPGPPGGRIGSIDFIDNYPGFPGGVSGAELGQRMHDHAASAGVSFEGSEAVSLAESSEGRFEARGGDGTLQSRAVIVATGAREKRLGVPGEGQLRGRGVSYCATCDGPLFRGKAVAVVGGGDSAITEALYLSRFCERVHVIHRRDSLRAAKALQEKAFSVENIRFAWNCIVEAIRGSDKVESLTVKDLARGATFELSVAGVFIYVGQSPNTEFLRGFLDLNREGYVLSDEEMRTSRPGVFAAGDVRSKTLRQVSTAVGDGALAGISAERYISAL